MCRCFLLVVVVLFSGCGVRVSPVEEISVESSGIAVKSTTVTPSLDSDWPWWRGPTNNGIAADQSLPTAWNAEHNVAWKAEIPGRGHSSPIIWDDQVFVATADEARQEQSVVAFDRATGDLKWQQIVSKGGFPSARQVHRKGTHANGTLACDGERIYGAFLANDQITAFALDVSGEEAWKQEVCAFNSKFGYAPSPLLYKSTVIFAADNRGGGCLAALDRESGQVAWRKPRPAVATYSSPVVANVAGSDQLLISGCNEVASYNPSTGDELWSCDGVAEATCGTIVWDDHHVFASGGYPEKETICVAADGSAKVLWKKRFSVYEPSMVVFNDYLYAVTDGGVAYCLSTVTGEEKWEQRLGGAFSASPVICNGLVYVTNNHGKTFVLRASPDSFAKVGENDLGSDTYASPAVCGGQLFLRVGEGEGRDRQEMLYCIGTPAG